MIKGYKNLIPKERINETGKRHSMLTVVSEAGRAKYGSFRWKCRCDCENIVTVRGDSLRDGTTQSCGCLQRETASRTMFVDETSNRYNRLTVIRQVSKNRNGDILWLCKCDCGNNKIASGRNLRRGDAQSCGCYRIERASCVESRIKMSCARMGINRDEWDGFAKRYCEKWTERLRKRIRDKHNNKCYLCGKSEKDNREKLSVHHVDRNKECGCNNKDCILVPLCRSCHCSVHSKDAEMWTETLLSMIESMPEVWGEREHLKIEEWKEEQI